MKLVPWSVALVLLLTSANSARADVTPVVYNTDPGFQQAYFADRFAVPVVFLSVCVVLIWLRQDRSRSRRLAAYGFFAIVALLVCYWGPQFVTSGDPIRKRYNLEFRNEPEPASRFPWGFGYSHRPERLQERTPAETILLGTVASAILCFGGLALVRWRDRRKGTSLVEGPSQTGSELP